MKRQQTTTLFNKNHIKLVRIDNVKYYYIDRQNILQDKTGTCLYKTSSTSSKTTMERNVEGKRIDDKHVEITCESPLGFYYKKEVFVTEEVTYAQREVVEFEYRYKFTKYILSFFTKYDDNQVLRAEDSLRPWDIVPGDKNFSDRDIEDLKSELDKLFEIIDGNGCKSVKSGQYYYSWQPKMQNPPRDLKPIKDEIYTYLFGNKKGFRLQTDKEKIEAHGFDFKYSFRKDKSENK